jgi:hypothetical protein
MPNGPRKLILIRAGRYDYAEVELSGSLQIVGPNNTGKTPTHHHASVPVPR